MKSCKQMAVVWGISERRVTEGYFFEYLNKNGKSVDKFWSRWYTTVR